MGMCALETQGVIGLSSVDPAALARPRGLAAAEDLLRGITLQPDGPLLVLDLDRILDAEAVRRTRVSRSRAQRPARSARVASGRSAPVAPSNGVEPVAAAARSAAGDDRPGACASREPRAAAPGGAAASGARLPAGNAIARDSRAGRIPRASGGRVAVGGVASRGSSRVARSRKRRGPRAEGGRRRSPGRDPLEAPVSRGRPRRRAPSPRWPSLRCSCGGARRLGWHRMRAPSRPRPSTGASSAGSSTHRCRPPPSGSRRSPRRDPAPRARPRGRSPCSAPRPPRRSWSWPVAIRSGASLACTSVPRRRGLGSTT